MEQLPQAVQRHASPSPCTLPAVPGGLHMLCPSCGFDNPAGMRFCGQCGTALAPRCPTCGTEAPAGFRFCGQCGASLAPAAAAPPTAPSVPTVASYTPRHLADKILGSRSALEGERR